MNKVHRIIWDEARGCFVVTHEKAVSRGKRSSTRSASVRAVAAAVMALGSGHALAVPSICVTGAYTIAAGTTSTAICTIGSGENLVVEGGSPGGAIVTSSYVAARVLAGTVGGSITNAGRIVSTGGSAITISGALGSITNSGSIGGSSAVVVVSSSTLTGGLTNSGTITGTSGNAVSYNGGTIAGGITNSGLMTGVRGIFSGTQGTLTGGITNSGTIVGTSNAISLGTSSSLSGGISNSGEIRGGAVGIYTGNGSSISGGIVNTGTIVTTSTSSGDVLQFAGTVDSLSNTGTIRAESIGVVVTVGGAVGLIDNAGTMAGAGRVAVSVTGSVSNLVNSGVIATTLAGTATGTIAGIEVAKSPFRTVAGSIGRIENHGTISADSTSASVAGAYGIRVKNGVVTDGISNSGTIVATITNGDGSGIVAAGGGTIAGGLTNSGLIVGQGYGVSATDGGLISDGVTNAGTIGGGIAGIAMLTGATLSGALVNSRIIVGALDGVLASGAATISGGITNSGTILGVTSAITIDETSVVPVIRNLAGGMIDGAILSGSAATHVTNAGTIAMPAGTVSTIAGNYVQEATGVLRTRVADDVTYGKLSVSGTVVLPSNAKIDVDVTTPAHAFTVSGLPDVIVAGSLVSDGTFAVTDNSTLFDFSAVKDGNTVDLVIAAAGRHGIEDAVLANGNTPATGAAQVLDRSFSNNPNGPLAQLFTGLTTQQQVSDAAAQVLPLLTGGSLQTGSAVLANLQRMIQSRMAYTQGRSSGESFLGDRNVWLRPFGSWAEQGERQGVAGFRANVAGVAAGFDVEPTERLRLGVAFAYANAGVDSKSTVAPQHMDTDVHQLIGYGSYGIDDRTEVNFQADIGHNRNRGTRTITFAPAVASASYDSLSLHAGFGLARTYAIAPDTRFIPSLRLDYTTMKDRAYGETGAGALNLRVDGRRVDQLLTGFDARLVHALSDRLVLGLDAGGGYDWLAERTSITATFAGEPGAAFTTIGNDPRPWVARGGAGLTYRTQAGMELTVRYDLEYRVDYLNQTASAKLRWMF